MKVLRTHNIRLRETIRKGSNSLALDIPSRKQRAHQ
uniref:Uncharacterized protein n=1 Tax=Setaria italica TaxID=4555 RepID=K3Z242_SETIT